MAASPTGCTSLRPRRTTRLLATLLLVWLASAPFHVCAADRPDVLFFVIDDLNDWISVLDPKSPIHTPHLERLASRGTLFTQAYCASPACNPSRAATLIGQRPSTTGVYGNKSDWRTATGQRPTILKRLRSAGYQVRGAGKIFHHHLDNAFHDDASFDSFQPMRPQLYPPEKLNRAPNYGSRNTDWGIWPERDEDSIDVQTANHCVEALSNPPPDVPLAVACGIFKPHSPFFAPRKYHASFANLSPPPRRSNDWVDLPSGARNLLRSKSWFWRGMMSLENEQDHSFDNFVRAYAACASFADAQIGRVLDALDRSPRRDQTLIVLWSDHGFHLGEKDHLEKFALWEKSNHIPFIIVAPGITKPGSICRQPVDMMVLYPTLLELCGLSPDPDCDGMSVVPLLRDPNHTWNTPALMTYGRGNHAVRSDRWRYIRYENGTQELYDHQSDPNEWNNLAESPEWKSVIEDHQQWIPTEEAEPVHDLRRSPDARDTSDARDASESKTTPLEPAS
ncbi:MAG: sulfatase [Rubripirellula sp.]